MKKILFLFFGCVYLCLNTLYLININESVFDITIINITEINV